MKNLNLKSVNSLAFTSLPTNRHHGILRRLRKNKSIIILQPDKGNGVVILDREIYKNSFLEIINDKSKFKSVDKDPTITREVKLQRKLRSNDKLDDETYKLIFPRGSQPARFYGLPKLRKPRSPNEPPPFRLIVSSIKAYNYNLAKYLCTLLNPVIPNDYITKDFCFPL